MTEHKLDKYDKYCLIKDIYPENISPPNKLSDLIIDTTSSEENMYDVINSYTNLDNIQYECTVCGHLLKSKYDLSHHAEKHLSEIPRATENKVCNICGKIFESKGSLHRHQSVQHDKIQEKYKRELEELDSEIKPFISRVNGIWTCQVF